VVPDAMRDGDSHMRTQTSLKLGEESRVHDRGPNPRRDDQKAALRAVQSLIEQLRVLEDAHASYRQFRNWWRRGGVIVADVVVNVLVDLDALTFEFRIKTGPFCRGADAQPKPFDGVDLFEGQAKVGPELAFDAHAKFQLSAGGFAVHEQMGRKVAVRVCTDL